MKTRQYLRSVRIAAERSVAFFSAENKSYRERWVVRSFLSNLGLRFFSFEVRSEQNEPPDVRYKQAAFEIKEILDQDRKRHAEYKAHAKRAALATHPDQLLENYTPKDMKLSDLVNLVQTEANRLTKKYSANDRSRLDLLCYINLQQVHGINRDLECVTGVASGFRSLSFLKGGNCSLVISASPSAPEFLRANVGRLAFRYGLDD